MRNGVFRFFLFIGVIYLGCKNTLCEIVENSSVDTAKQIQFSDNEIGYASDTIIVGIYVNRIYDIDYVEGSYKASLMIFVNSYQFMYDLENSIDIADCVSYSDFSAYVDSTRFVNGRKCYWTSIGIVAEIAKDFDATKFPFDKDSLAIRLEFNYAYTDYLVLKVDTLNSSIGNFKITDWLIDNSKLSISKSVFTSTFGDPNIINGLTQFNVLEVKYNVNRDSSRLFIKLFTALFLSFLIACCSLFLKNSQIEAKLSLIVGGLFGSIGNKYITEGLMPLNNNFTLSDKLHDLTLFYLLLFGIYAIYQHRKDKKDNLKSEMVSLLIVLSTYIIFVCVIL